MAKLFEEIFTDCGTGDIELHFPDSPNQVRLRCHALVLMQHPYFFKMLNTAMPLRERRNCEVTIGEPAEDFIEVLRFIYTGHIEITRNTVGGLLVLADKYCIDEVLDQCLKFVQAHLCPDTFFAFFSFTLLSTTFQDKLRELLLGSLKVRRHLCAVTEDPRWRELPADFVEELLAQDDLPIASEAEVLTLVAHWAGGQQRSRQDVQKLLATFRKCESLQVKVSDIDTLALALGFNIFSSAPQRTGAAVWDPPLLIHRQEAAGGAAGPLAGATVTEANEMDLHDLRVSKYQLGPKDYLQQEPGWMHPCQHRCRVTLECASWSHRERRSRPGNRSPRVAGAWDAIPAKASGRERSPSPPSKFQVLMPPREEFQSFDSPGQALNQDSLRGGLPQDKFEHDLVEHQIICGVVCGYHRYGARFTQRDGSGIYGVEDLNGKQFVNIGGTTSSVSFDLELTIGEPNKGGISRCRFAVLRGVHTALEEHFDASSKVDLRFYISSSYFDPSSMYTVSVKWIHPNSS